MVSEEPEEQTPVAVAPHTRAKRGRRPLPEWLERVEVVHELADEDKRCPHDGTALERIGEESSEQLDVIPARVQVIRHVRAKYACPACREHVRTAPVPPAPIPKSIASPGLLAHVAVSKYVDALPLYRQERIWQRLGAEIPRATLAHWMVKCGQLVQPLINLLRDELLALDYIHSDETPVQVLKEPGKSAQSKSFMWVQVAGDPKRPIVLFDYDPSRGGAISQAPVR
jgi:transposase